MASRRASKKCKKGSLRVGSAARRRLAGQKSASGRDRSEDWLPIDDSVERIDLKLLESEQNDLEKTQNPIAGHVNWNEGFKLPLGAQGRHVLLRKLRKVYHEDAPRWDCRLAQHGILLSRMPYATVVDLFKLAFHFGIFTFAVMCSLEFGCDPNSSRNRSQQNGKNNSKIQVMDTPLITRSSGKYAHKITKENKSSLISNERRSSTTSQASASSTSLSTADTSPSLRKTQFDNHLDRDIEHQYDLHVKSPLTFERNSIVELCPFDSDDAIAKLLKGEHEY